MTITLRLLNTDDQPLLWEMLYHAIHVPEGQDPPGREIIHEPGIRMYVEGWGREGDAGVGVWVDGQPVGAIWVRRWNEHARGYGWVADEIPELSIALLPLYRGMGLGTRLFENLFAGVHLPRVSLSVSPDNPARHLYERQGFQVISEKPDSLVMLRQTGQV